MDILIGILVGIVLSFLIFLLFKKRSRSKNKIKPKIMTYGSIDDIKTLGDLIVFKIITKEIVTTADHWFGDTGKKYFSWLVSSKKMAMIFEFEIDFRYDLRSNEFVIEKEETDSYLFKMPKCFYEIYIRDISFYDEQNAKFLPWLLPDLVNRVFDSGFDEEAKNLLKEEAKHQASQLSINLVQKLRSEVQNSACQTLSAIAKSFGAESVSFDFKDSDLIQIKVETEKLVNTAK